MSPRQLETLVFKTLVAVENLGRQVADLRHTLIIQGSLREVEKMTARLEREVRGRQPLRLIK